MQYHNTLDALAYYQTSAECEALYRQSFALARLALENSLREAAAAGVPSEHFHLITDCDETILDNSAYNVWTARTGRDFHQATWTEWCRTEGARATPGAMEFLHYADMMGVQIYYVTGRIESDREATAANLRKLGFPLVNSTDDPLQTRLFLEDMKIDGVTTKKLQQFAFLKQRLGDPLLRLGDNLSDHRPDRYGSSVRYNQRVTNLREDVGNLATKWIVFPNPIYGNWRLTLKFNEDGKDVAVKDEVKAPAYQADPVRPSLTPEEAPKVKVLTTWKD